MEEKKTRRYHAHLRDITAIGAPASRQVDLFQNRYMDNLIYFRYDLRGFVFNFKRSGMSRHGTKDLS